MKRIVLLLIMFIASCSPTPATISPEFTATEAVSSSPPLSIPDYSIPPVKASWQIQYTGEINTGLNVDVYNLDLFDTEPAIISGLHERSIYVMCYFSAGSFEDWRPDANEFPGEVMGNDMEGWPGEKWLDIRQINLLAPILESRLELAVEKNCDGVDPDNVNGYTNETGFPLTYEDQLRFNIWLAESAHARGLAIGLKNDLEQIPDLFPYFDWALNEQCFYYQECDLLLPFIDAGKAVFNIEYELNTDEFCDQANKIGINSIHKNYELDEYIENCKLLEAASSPPGTAATAKIRGNMSTKKQNLH